MLDGNSGDFPAQLSATLPLPDEVSGGQLPASSQTRRRSLLQPASAAFREPEGNAPPGNTSPRRNRSRTRTPPPADEKPGVYKKAGKVSDETNDIQEIIRHLIDGSVSKLPKDVQAAVRKNTVRLIQKIEALQRCNDRRDVVLAQIEALKKGDRTKDLPKCTVPFESEFWDLTWSSQPHSLACDLQPGITGLISFREAREQVHNFYLLTLKTMENDIIAKQREKLRDETSRRHYIDTCAVPAQKCRSAIHGLDLADNSSEDEFIQQPNLELELKKLYKSATEKVGQNMLQKSELKEKEKR